MVQFYSTCSRHSQKLSFVRPGGQLVYFLLPVIYFVLRHATPNHRLYKTKKLSRITNPAIQNSSPPALLRLAMTLSGALSGTSRLIRKQNARIDNTQASGSDPDAKPPPSKDLLNTGAPGLAQEIISGA